MQIGLRLKEERLNRKLTQEEVAEVLHVSRSTVSSWEVGRTFPDLDLLVALSNLYEISLDSLLKEDVQMIKRITKQGKTNKIFKIIILVISIILFFVIFINAYWFIKTSIEFDFAKDWKKDNGLYILSTDDATYMIAKPKYLDLKSDMHVLAMSSDYLTQSMYSDTDVIGFIYVEGVGSVHIDENMKFSQEINKGYTFTDGEVQIIEKSLKDNKNEIKNIYNLAKEKWEEINS